MEVLSHLGGVRKHFSTDGISISYLEKMNLGLDLPNGMRIILPNGDNAIFTGIELFFYQPDLSDPFECSSHETGTVSLFFLGMNGVESNIKIQGVYFAESSENIPLDFQKTDSSGYKNPTLSGLMKLSREVLRGCFVDGGCPDSSAPPISCHIEFMTGIITVHPRFVIPLIETDEISNLLRNELKNDKCFDTIVSFIDDMLSSGYLEYKFSTVEDGLVPDFKEVQWDRARHVDLDAYLATVSCKNIGGIYAHMTYFDFFCAVAREEVVDAFSVIFNDSKSNGVALSEFLPSTDFALHYKKIDFFTCANSEQVVIDGIAFIKLLAEEYLKQKMAENL